MLTGLFIVNIASRAELRPKAGLEPQLINGEGRPEWKYFLKSILDEDGYSEGLWRTAKANLIKDHAFCSGSPESNNFEGTERFLEHQLEKGVKFIGALAVNWLILRKLSIKGRHHRHFQWAQKDTCTFSRSSLPSTELSERSFRHFSVVPLTPGWLSRSFQSDASQCRQLRGRKWGRLCELSKGEKLFIAKAWEETLIIWGGLCICLRFLFLSEKTLSVLYRLSRLSHRPPPLVAICSLANNLLTSLKF